MKEFYISRDYITFDNKISTDVQLADDEHIPKGEWSNDLSMTCEVKLTHKAKRQMNRLFKCAAKKPRIPRKVKKAIKCLFFSAKHDGRALPNTKHKRKLWNKILRYRKEHGE